MKNLGGPVVEIESFSFDHRWQNRKTGVVGNWGIGHGRFGVDRRREWRMRSGEGEVLDLKLPPVASAGSIAEDDGTGSDSHDNDEKDESGPILDSFGVFVLRNFRTDHINMVRKGHHALEEKVEWAVEVPRDMVADYVSGGEHNWSGFSRHPSDSEDRGSEHARQGVG